MPVRRNKAKPLRHDVHDSCGDVIIATDKHLEPPLEKVNKQVGFRDPSLRTLLNKSTLRTFFSRVHLEPPQDIILYLIFTYKFI